MVNVSEQELRRLAADYATHGAVHMPGFLGHELLFRLQAIVDAAIAAIDQPATPGQASSFVRSDGRLTLRYLWRDNAELRGVLLRPEIAEPIAIIIGSKTLRFWFDLTFVHHGTPAGEAGMGTPWHHDVPTFSFKGDQMPSLWLALTPAHTNLSRLAFIDGSHRTNQGYYRSPEIERPAQGQSDGFIDLPDFDAMIKAGDVRMLAWDCAPGDAILLHPCTIHGARGNDGTAMHPRRVAMTTRWLGDDVRFLPYSYERAIKQPAVAGAQLKLGQRPRGDWFPLVYETRDGSISTESGPNQGA